MLNVRRSAPPPSFSYVGGGSPVRASVSDLLLCAAVGSAARSSRLLPRGIVRQRRRSRSVGEPPRALRALRALRAQRALRALRALRAQRAYSAPFCCFAPLSVHLHAAAAFLPRDIVRQKAAESSSSGASRAFASVAERCELCERCEQCELCEPCEPCEPVVLFVVLFGGSPLLDI